MIFMEVPEMNNKYLDCIALTVAIIGAVNWGLIGFFSIDLVSFIFGNMSWISRIIYAVVGISGLYLITFYMYTGGSAHAKE
ncbi:hypothetical protein IMSAG249_01067 [Lachnospiraceae bacterium]|jgi:uncharacterized membrane protein YuzA (DUF378 family)|nr:hypothetical protein IMSAGC009_00543 [Lachnospiraceae bacterium]GFI69246.1 hypothetical protein IMSAG249_01067 [Lachnospiraceae bacterium]